MSLLGEIVDRPAIVALAVLILLVLVLDWPGILILLALVAYAATGLAKRIPNPRSKMRKFTPRKASK